MELVLLFVSAAIVNNFVLSKFLGICPFLGVSKKIDSAVSMGAAVTFVMALTAAITWVIQNFILIPFDLIYLQNVAFIIVIASLVQFVEMFLRKNSPVLYQALGIFLPLITTNCAIMGLALFGASEQYSFIMNIVFALGAGAGFTLALVIMAGIREDLQFADVPKPFEGVGITLIVAGLLAMTFMGFAGLISS